VIASQERLDAAVRPVYVMDRRINNRLKARHATHVDNGVAHETRLSIAGQIEEDLEAAHKHGANGLG
jgi:hypothetical protein